ncbi:MAG: NAD(P)-dependent oxidoreductase [Oceanospirillaceae bacterium]|nr:NAD(P)-dependent oxidoreductase [Oceanospirillaceae bacterium]
MKRVLLTGAAGNLGKVVRVKLAGWADVMRLSDLNEITDAKAGEEVQCCDLGDKEAVMKLVEGCDGIIHLGGVSTENTFDSILNGNIVGTYNLYEAARKHGVKRILFASSNHTIGFHERDVTLDADSVMRPDCLYGVSKCYGEMLASLYYDKFGIETARVRIGSCFEKPLDRRMLATWLSADDFVSLTKRIFDCDRLGCPVIYAVSANNELWWDNTKVRYLGWEPKDSSAAFADEPYLQGRAADANDPAVRYQGGSFASAGHFED